MSNLPIPEEPKFVKAVTSGQKVLAGISGSLFFVVWLIGFDFIMNIFKPDYLWLILGFRMCLSLIALTCLGFVGYNNIGIMGQWIVDNYELYKRLSAFKKEQDENKSDK
jgi:hypothetical protein